MENFNYFAIKEGKLKDVIVSKWEHCKSLTKDWIGAEYKGFNTIEEAKEYLKPIPKIVDIYVDGAFRYGVYTWSFVAYKDGKIIFKAAGKGTNTDAAVMHNVAGECAAAMRAAKWCETRNFDKWRIYYNYDGIKNWVDGSWKTNKPYTKAYADFMKQYRQRVSFQKVTGHSGVEGNELAKKLAQKALEKRYYYKFNIGNQLAAVEYIDAINLLEASKGIFKRNENHLIDDYNNIPLNTKGNGIYENGKKYY